MTSPMTIEAICKEQLGLSGSEHKRLQSATKLFRVVWEDRNKIDLISKINEEIADDVLKHMAWIWLDGGWDPVVRPGKDFWAYPRELDGGRSIWYPPQKNIILEWVERIFLKQHQYRKWRNAKRKRSDFEEHDETYQPSASDVDLLGIDSRLRTDISPQKPVGKKCARQPGDKTNSSLSPATPTKMARQVATPPPTSRDPITPRRSENLTTSRPPAKKVFKPATVEDADDEEDLYYNASTRKASREDYSVFGSADVGAKAEPKVERKLWEQAPSTGVRTSGTMPTSTQESDISDLFGMASLDRKIEAAAATGDNNDTGLQDQVSPKLPASTNSTVPAEPSPGILTPKSHTSAQIWILEARHPRQTWRQWTSEPLSKQSIESFFNAVTRHTGILDFAAIEVRFEAMDQEWKFRIARHHDRQFDKMKSFILETARDVNKRNKETDKSINVYLVPINGTDDTTHDGLGGLQDCLDGQSQEWRFVISSTGTVGGGS